MAVQRQATGKLLQHGIVGGIVAGIVFAIVDMILAVVLMGAPFVAPLQMIGAIVLGPQAMDLTYPLGTAVITGALVHLVLSSIFGVIFVYLLAFTRQLNASTGVLLLYGSLFGLALWVVNFLIIAPIAFPWFAMIDQFWFGFVAHTFFFGTVLGGYVAAVRPGREEAPTR